MRFEFKSTLVPVALLAVQFPQEQSSSATCDAISPTTPIVEVGAFSNMRYTEEHPYGEAVLLWRAGPCIFGLFESAQGLQGDTPIGELEDLTHDPDTGALSFAARLTVGVLSGPGLAAPEPSRDLFTFIGTLREGRLAGTLTRATQLGPGPARTVTLNHSERGAEFMSGSATYEAWRAKWEPVLEVRGPVDSLVLGEVARDLTGDGQPETLRVVGVGRTTDHLDATLTIESAGRTVFRFTLAPLTPAAGFDGSRRTMSESEYRTWIEEFGRWFFAAEKFQRPAQFVESLRESAPGRIAEIPDVIRRARGPDDTREATAIRDEIFGSPATIFRFSPGGDRIEAIGWSAKAGRFYRLLECC